MLIRHTLTILLIIIITPLAPLRKGVLLKIKELVHYWYTTSILRVY